MCSLCARSGLKQHKGECNNSFSGTAKSMEPVGMVHCLESVVSRGGKVTELIVDNDGNTLEAIQVLVANHLLLRTLGHKVQLIDYSCRSYMTLFVQYTFSFRLADSRR